MRWRWAVIGAVALGLGTLVGFSAGCEHEREREVRVIRTRPEREVRVEREKDVEKSGHHRREVKVEKKERD